MTAITVYSFPCKRRARIVANPVVKHRTTAKGRKIGILCGKTKKCGEVCRIMTNQKAPAKRATTKRAAPKKKAPVKRKTVARR